MGRRRNGQQSYIVILVVLLTLASISTPRVVQLQSAAVASLSPTWCALAGARQGVVRIFSTIGGLFRSKKCRKNSPNHRLELENQQLRNTIQQLTSALHQAQQLGHIAAVAEEDTDASPYPLDTVVCALQQAIPAQVTFRSPDTWNNTLWIDIGWNDNPSNDQMVIAKDSPVVVGNAVVGVIDYVARKQSRVRLLTDSGITPSVRVARGHPQDLSLLIAVDEILDAMAARNDLLNDGTDTLLHLLAGLETLRQQLIDSEGSLFLAKGELHGSASALWRQRVPLLQGSGFNYDFPDNAGPARDLRTGKVIGTEAGDPIPLIQTNDLLITTGMDGVFPPGLRVATVTNVAPLREGAYMYELTARPAVANLDTLETVHVLPPSSRL